MTRSLPDNLYPASAARSAIVVALASLLILALFLPPAVNARQPGTESDPYRTELMDWSIAVSGPNYEMVEVALEEYPHGRGERVYIASVESLGFVEISLFDDDDSPEDTIDLMLRDFRAASQSLHVLDSGLSNNMHYALAGFELDQGIVGYFYIEVAEDIDGNVDLAQSIYTLDTNFLTQVDIARSEISMNGLPFLNEPVIDLESFIEADTVLRASTPEPVATPQHGTHVFETNATELVVDDPVEFDFPYTSGDLEVMFLSSAHGYGVVGYVHQEADSAEYVLSSVFVDAPVGAEAPVELYLESDGSHAMGVYRVQTQGETRAMVITIDHVDEGLWHVQAMAVTESEFAPELLGYQQGVTFDGEPFLGDVDAKTIEGILNDNQI